jgi:hypothetical protein
MVFEADCMDGIELIGQARHERMTIQVERFTARLLRKAAAARVGPECETTASAEPPPGDHRWRRRCRPIDSRVFGPRAGPIRIRISRTPADGPTWSPVTSSSCIVVSRSDQVHELLSLEDAM